MSNTLIARFPLGVAKIEIVVKSDIFLGLFEPSQKFIHFAEKWELLPYWQKYFNTKLGMKCF